MLKNCLSKIRGKSYFSRGLEKLLDEPIYTDIDELVTAIGQVKHEKANHAPDYMRAIKLLGNVFRDYCGKFQFGYFEDVQKKSFSTLYQGKFRIAFGAHTPFVDVLNYEGRHTFSEDQCVLLSTDTGAALLLEPIMFWFNGGHDLLNSNPDLYFYDIEEKSGFSYKRIGSKGKLLLTSDNFDSLIKYLKQIKEQDENTEILNNIIIFE